MDEVEVKRMMEAMASDPKFVERMLHDIEMAMVTDRIKRDWKTYGAKLDQLGALLSTLVDKEVTE